MTKARVSLRFLFTLLIVSTMAACGGGGGGGSSGPNCGSTGPGTSPSSGKGTESDPFVISLGVDYGGCAKAQADPGPIYKVNIPTSGTYTVTQTNGTTDLELWVYDSNENNIAVIDSSWGDGDESGSDFLSAGTYYIEVYNNGDVFSTGSKDGPFTLRVD